MPDHPGVEGFLRLFNEKVEVVVAVLKLVSKDEVRLRVWVAVDQYSTKVEHEEASVWRCTGG